MWGEYEHYGLRVSHSTDKTYAIGDIIDDNSSLWIDGEPTEIELNGVCAVEIHNGDIDHALKALEPYAHWSKQQIIVLAADKVSYGDELDEIIMVNPVVIDII